MNQQLTSLRRTNFAISLRAPGYLSSTFSISSCKNGAEIFLDDLPNIRENIMLVRENIMHDFIIIMILKI